ncbi:cation transporting ATPase C-terminal domain-containing protein [Parapedobacter sp. GCM10030251]|uniref:cation transporting ATPase C-terminal domain-containing protein n=1 Tax=Parapedobacter sp. GCM10030251 TaxID=3273419 RepID=UPI00361D3A4D
MGPTCSIVYENEPMERNTMQRPPRIMTDTFLNGRELLISIVQGLVITASVLFAYQLTVQAGGSEEKTRTMVFYHADFCQHPVELCQPLVLLQHF